MTEPKKILLIGGTSDAVQLNSLLFGIENIDLITSLAGRTQKPAPLKGEVMPHGFDDGGGLEEILKNRNIDCVIDASHPFAANIKQKAAAICEALAIPYLRYERPKWEPQTGDLWIPVQNLQKAAMSLGEF